MVFPQDDDPDEEFGEEFAPIISLIQGCPSLESLELVIRAAPWACFRGTWSLKDFLRDLHPWMSPSLRTFRMLGDVEPNWHYDLRNTGAGVLRSFFMRHPRLETVSLGWAEDALYSQMVPDVAVLFPSLRHLEAPACLCGPVLSSSLAMQIESVTVLDEVYDKFGYNFQSLASTASDLPRLRELVLHGGMDPRPSFIPVVVGGQGPPRVPPVVHSYRDFLAAHWRVHSGAVKGSTSRRASAGKTRTSPRPRSSCE